MTVLAFLLALGVLITVHEWGHYRVAVACGVKVISFSIGFGRPLLRWKSRKPYAGQDTEFLISLIPLGGYVKMLDEHDGDVSPQDAPRAFNRQPLWARAAIVSAGPLANLLLAVALYAATFWIGQYETQAMLSMPVTGSIAEQAGIKSGDTVLRAGIASDALQEVRSLERLRSWIQLHSESTVWLEVQALDHRGVRLLMLPPPHEVDIVSSDENAWLARGFSGPWARAVLVNVQPGLAADAAGLQLGDEVQRVNGRTVLDASDLRAIVRDSGRVHHAESQEWEIHREGQGHLFVYVKPDRVQEGRQYIGRIGAQLGDPPAKVWVQFDMLDGVSQAVTKTVDIVSLTFTMIGRLVTGQASLSHLSGPLVMADYAGHTASLGVAAYLGYLALVSVSLGVFNLLPLPVLDGGYLLYYLYEACTGHPPSPEWLDRLQRVGLIFLTGLMVFSLFNDVVRLGWLS
jgi:regulator of sigma E protease